MLALLAGTAVLEIVFAAYFPMALYVDLPLILVLYIGWRSLPSKGAWSGSAFGLLQDAVFRLYLGINGLSKTILGFLGSYLSQWLSLQAGILRPLIIALISVLDSLMVHGMLSLLGEPPGDKIYWEAGLKAILTGLAGEGVFRVYDSFKVPAKNFRGLGR